MNSRALVTKLDVWQAPGCAVRIDYSAAVMEELRVSACDGLNRLAHGGIEIGGVLFGVRDPDAVKILAHRALACEYAFGPSFTLWDNDRRALVELLASANTDSTLSGMQPVGWYHSHTRSDILLSEKDLQLFQQYFPETWQIALVLRPYRFDPVRAGFFFREPDGSVQAASSRHEFIVKPLDGKPVVGVPLAVGRVASDPALADTAPAAANPAIPEPSKVELESRNSDPCPQPTAMSLNPRSEPEPCPSPAAIVCKPGRGSWGRGSWGRANWGRANPRRVFSYLRQRWAQSAAVSAAAIAVLWALVLFSMGSSRASTDLSLRALDMGGQLRIDWNRNSRAIQQSQSGALEIEDGSLKVRDELSQEHLRAGSITYLRTTGNVLVRLLVRRADQSTLTEISRFLGPPPAPVARIATAATIATPASIATAPSMKGGSADRSAKNDGTDAGPVDRDRELEVLPAASVERASNQRFRPVSVRSESAGRTLAASAPARRQFVLPPSGIRRIEQPSLPSPPVIAANASAVLAAFPRLPAALNSEDQGPSAGRIIWTGKLARSGTIQIFGNRASQGHITGGLPGAPVRVQVFPSELTREGMRIFAADARSIGAPEAPGAQNGWSRTVYVLNPRKAGEIRILEAPGQQNAWNRLILRAERGDHAIIILRWERVPAESALQSSGNQ